MNTGRRLLADALESALPGWQIVSDPRALDGVRKPGACVLWTDKRFRQELNGFNLLRDELALWVLTAADRPDTLEDNLDQLLFDVLTVLESTHEVAWTEAERGVLAEKFQGYRVLVTCSYKITT